MNLATRDIYIKAVVWDILVEECDATPTAVAFADFAAVWPECREYRFMGIFGMGGKVWWNNGHAYVTCYREEESPKRLAARDVANERLMKLAVPSASDAPKKKLMVGTPGRESKPGEAIHALYDDDGNLASLSSDDASEAAESQAYQRGWRTGATYICEFLGHPRSLGRDDCPCEQYAFKDAIVPADKASEERS